MDLSECIKQTLQPAEPVEYSMVQNHDHQSHQLANNSETIDSDQCYDMPSNQVSLENTPTEQPVYQTIPMQSQTESLNKLLDDLTKFPEDQDVTSPGTQEKKIALNNHRLFPLLRDVFYDMKKVSLEKRAQDKSLADEKPKTPNAQLLRLNKMLIVEGIANTQSDVTTSGTIDNDESVLGPYIITNHGYRNKLKLIRMLYHEDLAKYDMHCKSFKDQVRNLLCEQCTTRPITVDEAQRIIDRIHRKFEAVEILLKQQTCESVMSLRSRYLDARRKRRNFDRKASNILETYFYSHLHNPYPSDYVKKVLAKQCNITVSQVANWFNNKRIRYKKISQKLKEMARLPPPTTTVNPLLVYDTIPKVQRDYRLMHYETPSDTGYDRLYYGQRSSA